MADLSKCIGLAVIGIEAAGAGFYDTESYGFRIYHSIEDPAGTGDSSLSDSELRSMIEKTILQAGMKCEEVAILPIQPQLEEKCLRSGISTIGRNITEGEKDISQALLSTIDRLETGEVDAVLLLDENSTDHSVAAVLISTERYAADVGKTVFGVIAGAADDSESDTITSTGILINSAFESANIQPSEVGLFLTKEALQTSPELIFPKYLIAVFSSAEESSCALSGSRGGLFSILKAVWCLHQRIIPGTKGWTAPASPELWQNSTFYIPTESRTWFTSNGQPARYALTNLASQGKTTSVIIFREGRSNQTRNNSALRLENLFLYPVSGASPQDIVQNLANLQEELSNSPDLRNSSSKLISRHQAEPHSGEFTACILGCSKEELSREIDFAIKGIPSAFEKKTEWRTPGGSFFSASPLGNTGKVSFVYPGAFNSYPGIARSLFYLFPDLYDRLGTISSDLGALINEKKLYPRCISPLSPAEMDQAEKDLATDPLAMLISGTSLAAVFTFLLREVFDLHPASAFGYSLGEISMMFASGCWTQADQTSAALRTSPLFRTRLAGPQNAVRENWGIPPVDQAEDGLNIWENYVLMATPDDVRSALEKENRVYLTHINTPRQVVIAGDPSGCRRVIEALKCNSLQAPFNYALHCEAMRSEFNALQDLLSWPVTNQPDMKLYSAAEYQAVPIEQKIIASQIATGLCHTLDFPQLVNRAFEDGARIFIELGAGSNCGRWVDESLKDKPHAAFSINRKGLDDLAAVLQLLAKLICHHVPLNLEVLVS